jgi:hypothetical protein
VSYRPLAFVSGLTFGDYLLWNWSLNANHDVLALVSGLTLPPLALACLAMLAVNLLRLLGRSTHRSGNRAAVSGARGPARAHVSEDAKEPRAATAVAGSRDAASASSGGSPSSPGKLAA